MNIYVNIYIHIYINMWIHRRNASRDRNSESASDASYSCIRLRACSSGFAPHNCQIPCEKKNVICKLGFYWYFCKFAFMLLIKIVLCSWFPETNLMNYMCLRMMLIPHGCQTHFQHVVQQLVTSPHEDCTRKTVKARYRLLKVLKQLKVLKTF